MKQIFKFLGKRSVKLTPEERISKFLDTFQELEDDLKTTVDDCDTIITDLDKGIEELLTKRDSTDKTKTKVSNLVTALHRVMTGSNGFN